MTDASWLLGALTITVGAAWWSPPFGVMVAGGWMVAFGVVRALAERNKR